MKKSCLIIFLILISTHLFGEISEKKFGIQLSSDTNVQAVLRLKWLEFGVGVQAFLGDGTGTYANQGLLKPNIYTSFRFYSDKTPFTFTTGVEAGIGIGLEEIDYDQYIELSLRLGFDYKLNEHFRVSGILYPLWLSTIEISDVSDSWGLQVQIPKASVAVAYFF